MSWRSLLVLVLAALAIAVLAPFIPVFAASSTCGIASFYGSESGHITANGEHFDGTGMTAASRSLRFDTVVRVTDQATGRNVTVRINDRGPYVAGRILDLSQTAARRLGMGGLARVCLTIQ